jgi:hypothetical protein
LKDDDDDDDDDDDNDNINNNNNNNLLLFQSISKLIFCQNVVSYLRVRPREEHPK